MLLALSFAVALIQPVQSSALVKAQPHILVFDRALGHKHDSIPVAEVAMQKLSREKGFTLKITADPAEFTDSKLSQYDSIVFLLTTLDVLDVEQQGAMERFIRKGGGFAGVHSATDTEYEWPFYTKLIGAQFGGHAAQSEKQITIEDRFHPSTVGLPAQWTRVDEWYNFRQDPRPNVRVLASVDGTPMTWCQEIEGSRSWYTAMGHTDASWTSATFLDFLYEGILWTAQAKKPATAEMLTWPNVKGWQTTGDVIENSGDQPVHLRSAQEHGDALVHVEFKIPKGSNSGVYLQGRYEVQILDSFGKATKDLDPSDCGGIYQRWIEPNGPGYEGTAPLVNAFRGPGSWNSYDILFRAPRFDQGGKKIENARFVEVRLNGVVIQKNVGLTGMTRAGFFNDERAAGPIFLQGDHGPVAYRNVWIQPLKL